MPSLRRTWVRPCEVNIFVQSNKYSVIVAPVGADPRVGPQILRLRLRSAQDDLLAIRLGSFACVVGNGPRPFLLIGRVLDPTLQLHCSYRYLFQRLYQPPGVHSEVNYYHRKYGKGQKHHPAGILKLLYL